MAPSSGLMTQPGERDLRAADTVSLRDQPGCVVARLRATGRAAHAEHLAARHPDELAGTSTAG